MTQVESFADAARLRIHTPPQASPFVVTEDGHLPLIELDAVDEDANGVPPKVAVRVRDSAGHRFVVRVDDVLGRKRVLLAPISAAEACLGRPADASVFGDDEIGYVLDVDALLARHATGCRNSPAEHPGGR